MMIFEYIISTIAPHLCLSCRIEGTLLCKVCALTLPGPAGGCVFCHSRLQGKIHTYACRRCQSTLPFDHLIIAVSYEGVAKELVHKLKFERARAAANPIAQILASCVGVANRCSVVAHVPTANKRVRQRGYDQSALLGRQLARHLGLPAASLLRRHGSKRQLGQGRRTRQEQLKDAFWTSADLTKQHVILVDDVITTGASIQHATAVLRAAGAASITVVVFARA